MPITKAWTAESASSLSAPSASTLPTGALPHHADLEAIDRGRLVLRPFPTATARRLSSVSGGIDVAPWTRVCGAR